MSVMSTMACSASLICTARGLAFFKGGDAYPYASGFSDAAEAMGFRIAWNREQGQVIANRIRHL